MKKVALGGFVLVSIACLFASTAGTRLTHAAFASADLSVTKVDNNNPHQVNTGSNLTYTITVTNNGPDAAANASWSDTLPAGTSFWTLPDVSGWSCTTPAQGDNGTISCSNPSFAVGSSVFTLTVAVAPTVPAGSILSNTATATSSTPDGNPGNESDTATTTVHSPANVTGNKSRSGGSTPGATLSYLIVLSNSSNSDQQNNPGNEFTDVLPADLTLVGASASAGTATANTGTNTVTWNGVVPAMDSVTISIDATIKTGTEGHTIANTGTISYDANGVGMNQASASTNTDSFVVGAAPLNADLGVTKTAPDTSPADSDVTYTITVTNGGPDTATSATLTDPLQGNMTFVSLSQPAGWSCNSLTQGSGGTLTCSRDLPAGSGPQVFTLVGHIPPGTADGTFYNNMATVSTTATDPTAENNTATAGTTVACATNPIVSTSLDSGMGSLRKAILDACDGATITFDMTPGHVTSPITLTSGELLINKNLTITGPGANLLTVKRDSAAPTFRIFEIANSAITVNISGMTVSNGRTADGTGAGGNGDFGGGILNNAGATLNLKNVAVSGNQTGAGSGIGSNGGSGGLGGGVFNFGTLTIVNSTISGNQTGAGGVGNPASGGRGGDGGGVYTFGTLTLVNSTVSGNQTGVGGAGGGAGNGGGGGFGGGVYNDTGTLTLVNSTISGNQTGAGATGSVGNNGSGGSSGGVQNSGNTANVKNTIIAGNTVATGGQGPDLLGTFNSQDYNLIGNTTGATINGTTTHNIINTSANLGVLANNGGQTQTMLPLATSPAINAGDPANLPADTFDLNNNGNTAEALPVDQRGFARVVGGNFDIGAVETNYIVTATAGAPQSATINSAFATALKATVTESGIPQNLVSVTFTAPASGASGSFPGPSTTAVAATNSSGVATAPTFTANGTAGSYNVVASIGTGLPTAAFALTNTAATSTTVTSSVNPSDFGQSVTFTATVASAGGTPTGTVQFADGVNILGAAMNCVAGGGNSCKAQVSTSALTAGTHNISATYSGDTNFIGGMGSVSQVVKPQPPQGGIISFSQPNYSVNEDAGFLTLTVNRTGDTTRAATVDYATSDDSDPASMVSCAPPSGGVASSRCDFNTALGTLRFAAGETSKTFVVLISQDAYIEGPEAFPVTLSNLTGGAVFAAPSTAIVTINDVAPASPGNPIDVADSFVKQHYRDFLNRQADPAGLAFWTNEITSCGANAACIETKRIHVSAAFFLSIEFLETGGYAIRMQRAAFGKKSQDATRMTYLQFINDARFVGDGVVIGQPGADAKLNANKDAYATQVVTSTAFTNAFGAGLTGDQFVTALFISAGVTPTPAEQAAAVAAFGAGGTAGRAAALRSVADSNSMRNAEFNSSFVLMEYHGYLRRNPDTAGYNFWLNKLNAFNGDFIAAEMVKAFISSAEYRQRFGP